MRGREELEGMAEAATFGPWTAVLSDSGQIEIFGAGMTLIGPEGFLSGTEQDWPIAQFIAAANPQTVLSLISENESLVKLIMLIHKHCDIDEFSEEINIEVVDLLRSRGLIDGQE